MHMLIRILGVLDFETADNHNLLGGSSPLFPTKQVHVNFKRV